MPSSEKTSRFSRGPAMLVSIASASLEQGTIQIPMRVRFAVLPSVVLSVLIALLPSSGSAEPAPAHRCESKIRAVYVKLDDPKGHAPVIGTTRFTRAITEKILEAAEVDFELSQVPYARAVLELGDGRADAVVISELAVLEPHHGGVKVPLMRLQMVLYSKLPSHDFPLSSNSVIGNLRGFSVPVQLSVSGARIESTTSIESMLQMLAKGRISHALMVRGQAELLMAESPELKQGLGETLVVGQQHLIAYFSDRLKKGCSEKLRRAAIRVRAAEMEGLFLTHLPHLDYEKFRY